MAGMPEFQLIRTNLIHVSVASTDFFTVANIFLIRALNWFDQNVDVIAINERYIIEIQICISIQCKFS